jgi:putative membrane protein
MKVLRLSLLLVFLLVGVVIGVLNSDPIRIDLVFSSIPTTSGAAIMVALLAGVLVGATLVVWSAVIPLYSKLRQANKRAVASRVDADPVATTHPNAHS